MKIKRLLRSDRSFALLLAVVLSVGNILLLAPQASAASLTQSSIRLNRLSTATGTTFRLIFKTSASASGTTLTINFNGSDTTTWTGGTGSVAASEPVSNTACATDSAGAAFPGSPAGTGSGSTISFTGITTWATSTVYCEDFTSVTAATTPTVAATYHPVITAGSDTITVAVSVVSNDSIVVTAIVPPTFSMSFGSNTDTFTTNLSNTASSSTSGVGITVNTNAKNGWIAWAKDANSGLASTTASKTIASGTAGSAVTLASNTEGYGVGASITSQGTGGGTASVPAAYSGSNGGGVDTNLRQIVSSTGTANTAVFSVKEYAEISPTTPAANDYTDTITVVGAGSF